MARQWARFPYPEKAYAHDVGGLKKHWARLHRGDLHGDAASEHRDLAIRPAQVPPVPQFAGKNGLQLREVQFGDRVAAIDHDRDAVEQLRDGHRQQLGG